MRARDAKPSSVTSFANMTVVLAGIAVVGSTNPSSTKRADSTDGVIDAKTSLPPSIEFRTTAASLAWT
jgi:hypothetical protein